MRLYVTDSIKEILKPLVMNLGTFSSKKDTSILHQFVNIFFEQLLKSLGRHKRYCIAEKGVQALSKDVEILRSWVKENGFFMESLPALKRLSMVLVVMSKNPAERKLSMSKGFLPSLPDAKRWIALCVRVSANETSARIACSGTVDPSGLNIQT